MRSGNKCASEEVGSDSLIKLLALAQQQLEPRAVDGDESVSALGSAPRRPGNQLAIGRH